ncbi:MAG: TIGR02391 family protein [Candidatus Nanopelagicales bacterium]
MLSGRCGSSSNSSMIRRSTWRTCLRGLSPFPTRQERTTTYSRETRLCVAEDSGPDDSCLARSTPNQVEVRDTLAARFADQALRAIGVLRRDAELRANLGEDAPLISLASLHPWVWDGARSLWQSGHHREAVEGAIRKLNAETQNKLCRRDLGEVDLFKQAFSLDPADVGKPRLRRVLPDDSKTYRSVQRGAIAFAEGIFAGIRNPLAHEADEDMSEQEAIEYLAALSVLARWVDDSELEERLMGFQTPLYELSDYLKWTTSGRIQLPDFQRGYKWEDERIRQLLVTILRGHPLGVVMLLKTGNDQIRFKPRPVEGTDVPQGTSAEVPAAGRPAAPDIAHPGAHRRRRRRHHGQPRQAA